MSYLWQNIRSKHMLCQLWRLQKYSSSSLNNMIFKTNQFQNTVYQKYQIRPYNYGKDILQSRSYNSKEFIRYYKRENKFITSYEKIGPLQSAKLYSKDKKNPLSSIWKILGCSYTMYIIYSSFDEYSKNLKINPYTQRHQFINTTNSGEFVEKYLEDLVVDKILPINHPESIRINFIAKKIIDATMCLVTIYIQDCMDNSLNSINEELNQNQSPRFRRHKTFVKILEKQKLSINRHVHPNANCEYKNELEKFIVYLNGLQWKVVVWDCEELMSIMCNPFTGTITVPTSFLKIFPSDNELAFFLAHEVGHVIARHGQERFSEQFWLRCLQVFMIPVILQYMFVRGLVLLYLGPRFLIELPILREQEYEADKMALLFMAAGDFDPRPTVQMFLRDYENLKDYDFIRNFRSSPPSKKRAESIHQSSIMQEATKLYLEKFGS